MESSRQTPPRVTRYGGLGRTFCLLALILPLGALLVWMQQTAGQGPPQTRTDSVEDSIHGVEIVDPYRWLEDRKSPETETWIKAENNHTQSILAALPGRVQVKQRLTELNKIETIYPPIERNGRYFFSKRLANQELFVIYMREGLKGNDQVLIDPHPMSPDHSTSVDLMEVSKDGALMAYGVRQGGEDENTVRVLNVEARKDLPDRLPRGRYFGVSFKPDKSGFYYTRHETEGSRVYYHALGTDPAKDIQLFGNGYGPDKIIFANLSEDGRYLLIQVLYGAAADRTEIYYQDVAVHGPIKPVVNDLAARFFGTVGGDQLFLRTNWRAPKSRILAVDLKNPARDRWHEVVPESDAPVEALSLVGGKLVANYTRKVSSQVKVFEPDGKYVRDVVLPAVGTANLDGRWESPEGFMTFSSYPIPMTIYRYDMATGAEELFARQKVPVDSDRLEVKQVWYGSKDKTRIPMFLVHAKGMQLDGSRPTLLTGYGGFNVSYTPWFSSVSVLWAEQGGVYAVANLRGGGEFGEEWHKAGMLDKKQNVFDDFIAAAEWLIQNRYTNPSKLAIEGTSNGGLLVGAALTQRPDLFGAVACGYPLLDMLRYHKFLVAQFWVPEYGSSDSAAQFKYLYAYSPYHHVKLGTKYPATLLFTGDSDTRVDPLHARKMTALLQSVTASDRPILLRYETTSGHSGGLPLSKELDEMTDEQVFLFWQLGVLASPR
jgi:prolyl oligopeptidase